MRLRVTIWRTTLPCSRLRLRSGLNCGICWGLTFDMRGGRQLAKPDVARPLDGRVSPQLGGALPRRDGSLGELLGCHGACMRKATLTEPRLFPHLYSDALLV